MTRSNENEIQKLEHDDVYDVKKVSNFLDDGEGGLVREDLSTKENTLRVLIKVQETLEQLLIESKITNVHQKTMTDEDVLDSDVETR